MAEREHARLGLFKPILLLQALPYQKSQALQSYTVSPFGIWVPLLLSFRWLTSKLARWVGGIRCFDVRESLRVRLRLSEFLSSFRSSETKSAHLKFVPLSPQYLEVDHDRAQCSL